MTAQTLKKRGLGKGLANLLSNTNLDLNTLTKSNEKPSQLPIEKLQPGKYQPRKELPQASLEELANSIRVQGVIQPVVVRSVSPQHYEIIAGERRWRAAQLAGLSDIPVVIRDVPDEAAIAMALIENIQRENLNPLEEAVALKRLQDEFQLTQQQVAQAIGKSRVTVTNLLRLLELNEEVKQYLQSGKIDQGHAKVLLALSGLDQFKAVQIVVEKKLSVRETEQLVQQWHKAKPQKSVKQTDPNIGLLERQLSDQLGTSVVIQHQKNGRGKLVIHYRTTDILEGILEKIK